MRALQDADAIPKRTWPPGSRTEGSTDMKAAWRALIEAEIHIIDYPRYELTAPKKLKWDCKIAVLV